MVFAQRRWKCGWGEWSLVGATLEAVRAAVAAFPRATHFYITHSDTPAQAEWLARKIVGLRLFEDAQGLTNLGLEDVGGALLVVSQFTLYADAAKGRRPSFIAAAPPGQAEPLVERFVAAARAAGARVATGVFRAHMQVALVNDGPVTLILEH